ncbi:MAG: hypothetical protein M3R55_01515 [Acidobacteriota bacterium]|nr:hypothetical protein [Acidobacteriota bacterium]
MSNPTYIQHIVGEVNKVTAACGPILIFGENINYGSRIGGLARGLTVNTEGLIQNVGNCELTHVGMGLGMLLDGGQAALFGKQLDFILLGLEQACNTFNFIRAYQARETWGSFTIFVIVCDQGFQGPQSSLNAAGDFASLANIPVYCLNGAEDAARVVARHFASPGFRVICLSQRLFAAPALTVPVEAAAEDESLFRYASGDDATIVSLNFSLRDALEMRGRLATAGAAADLFHVNFIPGMDLAPVIDSCRRTGKLIVVDDSKTVTKFGDAIIAQTVEPYPEVRVLSLHRRGCPDEGYGANPDRFLPDTARALAFLGRA